MQPQSSSVTNTPNRMYLDMSCSNVFTVYRLSSYVCKSVWACVYMYVCIYVYIIYMYVCRYVCIMYVSMYYVYKYVCT